MKRHKCMVGLMTKKQMCEQLAGEMNEIKDIVRLDGCIIN